MEKNRSEKGMLDIIILAVLVYLGYVIYTKVINKNVESDENVSLEKYDIQRNAKEELVKRGESGMNKQELLEFIEKTKRFAAEGNVMAMATLANIYSTGDGGLIPANKKMELEYLRMGADRGDAKMAYLLAIEIGNENTNDKNFERYLKIAADGGVAEAKYDMHLLLRNSKEEEKIQQATVYLNDAAKAGCKEALDLVREYAVKSGMSEEEIEKFMKKFKDNGKM